MAGGLVGYLYRPGWRLRCIDPPIAWMELRGGPPLSAAIRLQLTSYLTSRWAEAVRVKDTQLAVRVDDRRFVVPAVQATDAAGVLYAGDDGYEVDSRSPHHAIVDYVTDAPDLVAALCDEGPALSIAVEALMNTANSYREIATLDLARTGTAALAAGWQQLSTGREIE